MITVRMPHLFFESAFLGAQAFQEAPKILEFAVTVHGTCEVNLQANPGNSTVSPFISSFQNEGPFREPVY